MGIVSQSEEKVKGCFEFLWLNQQKILWSIGKTCPPTLAKSPKVCYNNFEYTFPKRGTHKK